MSNNQYKKLVIKPEYNYIITAKAYKLITNHTREKDARIKVGEEKKEPIIITGKISNAEGVTIALHPLETVVLNGIFTIHYYCRSINADTIFTPEQLFETITNTKISNFKNHTKSIAEIKTILERLNTYKLSLDTSNQENWKNQNDEVAYSFGKVTNTTLIKLQHAEVINRIKKPEDAYILTETPLFISYAEKIGHFITTIPIIPNTTKINKKSLTLNFNNIILKNYIIDEVGNNKHQDNKKQIYYVDIKTLYQKIYETKLNTKLNRKCDEYMKQYMRINRLKTYILMVLTDMEKQNVLKITDASRLAYKPIY